MCLFKFRFSCQSFTVAIYSLRLRLKVPIMVLPFTYLNNFYILNIYSTFYTLTFTRYPYIHSEIGQNPTSKPHQSLWSYRMHVYNVVCTYSSSGSTEYSYTSMKRDAIWYAIRCYDEVLHLLSMWS